MRSLLGRRIELLFMLVLFLRVESVSALTHYLPSSLVSETLSETVPTAIPPAKWTAADFVVEWNGKPLSGVQISLGQRSLEWVRVADFLTLPRARLLIQAKNLQAGVVMNAGFAQPFVVNGDQADAEIPVALVSGEKNPISIVIRRDQKELRGEIRIRFKPRPEVVGSRIFTDLSCSSYKLNLEYDGQNSDDWVYVGCRLVYVEGDQNRTSSLETFVYWDNVGQTIQVEGIETPASSVSVWALRLQSKPGAIVLKAGNRQLKLSYAVPSYLHMGSLGVGVGPYTYVFDAPGVNVNTVAPLVTFYASYFIFETMRLAAFGATTLNSVFNADLGVYLSSESFKVLDRRISMNVMLGGHLLGFRAQGSKHVNFGLPQGIELTFKDAFKKGKNLTFGSFVFPPIDGKSYYNVWVRWGSSGFFGEINYIGWQEKFEQSRIYSRNVGLSIGFPIVRFL